MIGALAVTGAVGVSGPAAAAPTPVPAAEQPADGESGSIDVTISDAEYQALVAEGKKREAGLLKTPGAPAQAAVRPASIAAETEHRKPVSLETASRQSRQMGAQHPSPVKAAPPVRTGATGPVTNVAPAIGDQPDQGALDQCMTSDAENEFGHVLNRFVYCKRFETQVNFYRVVQGFRIKMGETEFTYELVGQGDDHARRIRTFARIQEDSVDYDWRIGWEQVFIAPYLPLSFIMNCVEDFEVCNATRGPVVLPFVTWDNNTDWFYWDVYNFARSGVGRDVISYNQFYLEFQALGYGVSDPGHSASRRVRCDSATYLAHGTTQYPEACVFAEVIPHLNYQVGTDHGSVALHIATAQDRPNDTWPKLVPEDVPPPRDKRIPGKYQPGVADAPGLHRITAELHPGQTKDNEDHKEGACYKRGTQKDLYLDTGLPTPPDTSVEQCDEYPFGSTLEGAAHPDWDFSVRAVPQRDNSVAGGILRAWYTDDRILAWDAELPAPDITNDEFYVNIE
ncbi:Deoxyribonuclease NucA/NucB [Paractinoplanes atraurantiacus]|uniref:Deoxyribonuclease NucA/NucB n=2 Tax=Paractinoplanes atraurantiacus TaxID=1036182 RepID=A0A285KL37_9ACTN|nr:Deoxyribonuclease NucA/NucB [Actinoplanes atraurantiacus]